MYSTASAYGGEFPGLSWDGSSVKLVDGLYFLHVNCLLRSLGLINRCSLDHLSELLIGRFRLMQRSLKEGNASV